MFIRVEGRFVLAKITHGFLLSKGYPSIEQYPGDRKEGSSDGEDFLVIKDSRCFVQSPSRKDPRLEHFLYCASTKQSNDMGEIKIQPNICEWPCVA